MRTRGRTVTALVAAISVVISAAILGAQERPPQAPANHSRSVPAIPWTDALGRLPLSFEANVGQSDPRVKFLSRGEGQTLFLASSEAVLVSSRTGDVLRMTLLGANDRARVVGREELPGPANYFIGNDPRKWRTNVPTYAKVQYDDVYPGIDLVYYGNQRQLEYDLVVRPGGAPDKILLRFDGADSIVVDAQGDLVLHTAAGVLRQQKPIIYQDVDGSRQTVAGGYVSKGSDLVGFTLAEYDRSLPLVIDPVLVYSTYLGGGFIDEGRGIAVDGSGNVYVTGITQSTDFPTASPLQPTKRNLNGANAFVAKLNPAGTALLYSTYLGGTGPDPEEYGAAIAIDVNGNAYVTGKTTSFDFPTVGPIQTANAGGNGDAFVAKLNSSGSALLYSTYLGGSKYDYASGIAVDGSGNAYVTGRTQIASGNNLQFPTTAGAFKPTVNNSGSQEAFVAKVNTAGTALVYSTFLGGSSEDEADAIAVDAAGHAYVTGLTWSADFPISAGAFQQTFPFHGVAFVTKVNPAGSALVYSTYLGGAVAGGYGDTHGRGIAVDASGNAYVTGGTASTAFPTTSGALRETHPGANYIAFVTKLNPTGTAPVYSTLLGEQISHGYGIAVDGGGNAYVAGHTYATNFPTVDPIQSMHAGGPGSAATDAFVAKVNAGGNALVYSTFFGGTGTDMAWAIAVDGGGNAYVTGSTSSMDLPTSGPIQMTKGGLADAFIAKIGVGPGSASDLRIVKHITAGPVVVGGFVTTTLTVTNDGPDPAPDVVVEDALSPGQQFAGSTGGNCSPTGASTITCHLGTMAVGSSITFYIDLMAQAAGTISDTATARYSGTDPDPTDNSASASVAVLPMPFSAGPGTPVIDGVLAPGEWNSTGCQQLTLNLPNGGTTPASLCAMNDTTNVYFSLRYDRTVLDPGNSFGLEFDNDNDGVMEEGDDVILHNPAAGFFDDYRTWLPPCPAGDLCGPQDIDGGGTTNGNGAFQHHGTFSVYELSHPLNSGDSHDFALCGGQKVGFFAFVRMMSPGGVWPADFGDTTWPGWQQYVELTLSGTCAPPPPHADVRVTASVAPATMAVGDTARITVTVSNLGPDATSNVSVENVFTPGQLLAGTAGATCVPSFSYVVDCNVGTLAAGSSATFTIDVIAAIPGTVSNTANVSHSAIDPDYSNNVVSASAIVVAPSVSGSGTAIADGTLAAGEWSAAGCVNFDATIPGGGVTPARVCAMNDLTNVYFSVRFDRTVVDPDTWLSISFDADRDGTVEPGDDWIHFKAGDIFADGYQHSCPGSYLCGSVDVTDGGTTDGAASFQHHGTYSVFELSHPLKSGDSHDIALCPGQRIGFYLSLAIGSASAPIWPRQPNAAELTLSGECQTQTVVGGQTVTTDSEADGATPDDVVETSVTTPTGGAVSIAEAANAGTAPGGYSFLANAVQITAPPAPAGQYLTIVFRIDASAIPAGTALGSIQVTRNGVILATCISPANPLPCVSRQLLPDNDVELTIYTAQASVWEFLLGEDVTPPSMTCSITPKILWPANKSLIPVVANIELADTQSGADGFTLTSVSNDDGNNAASMQGFIIGAADVSGMLRAERSGKSKSGRHYTLTYEGRDRAGNTASCSVVVTVPHDRGK